MGQAFELAGCRPSTAEKDTERADVWLLATYVLPGRLAFQVLHNKHVIHWKDSALEHPFGLRDGNPLHFITHVICYMCNRSECFYGVEEVVLLPIQVPRAMARKGVRKA